MLRGLNLMLRIATVRVAEARAVSFLVRVWVGPAGVGAVTFAVSSGAGGASSGAGGASGAGCCCGGGDCTSGGSGGTLGAGASESAGGASGDSVANSNPGAASEATKTYPPTRRIVPCRPHI
jgi:hypothetical protein